MTIKKIVFILLLLLKFNLFVQAQTVIPFKLYEDKFIIIKLPALNGKDSLIFYFDTGASTTLLDTKLAAKYNIKTSYKRTVPGASGSRSYDIATNHKIRLTDDVVIENITIVLEDLERLNNTAGIKFDGIIGNDILKNYLTKIDFDSQNIYLYPFNEILNTSEYKEINFSFKNNIPIPQFPLTIALLNGEKFTEDILFDSGAGLSLFLNKPFQEKNNILKKVGKTLISDQNNLSGKASTTLAVIKSIEIGEFIFEGKIPISISSDEAGVSSYPGYLGILGSEIINRFNIILNYHTKQLFLNPNELFSKKITLPVSPVKLSLANDKIIISAVIENSQAYKLGLREGQVINSINGNATATIQSYRKMLNEEGKEIIFNYVDDKNENKECRFLLESLF